MRSKKAMCLALVLVLVLAFTACASPAADPTPTPDAGTNEATPPANPDDGADEGGEDPAPAGEVDKSELYTVDVFSMTSNYAGIVTGWFGKILKEKFNMEHNVIATNLEGGASKFATAMASGYLGEIVVFGDSGSNMLDAIEAGLVMDWNENDLLQNYGKEIVENFPLALEYNKVMFGGGEKVLGMGYNVAYTSDGPREGTDFTWGPYLRWDLYKELGSPEIKDIEDYLPLLKQMQDLEPTSDSGKPTYAFSFWADWDSSHMMNAKQFAAMHGFNDDSGGFLLVHADEEKYQDLLDPEGWYYRTLKLYFDANQMGLVDPDSISQKQSDMVAKLVDGQVLFNWFGWASNYNTDAHIADGKSMLVVPFENEEVYSYGMTQYGGNRTTCIGSTAKQPERIMDFLNWLYSEEGIMTYLNGPEGMLWEVVDGKLSLTELGWNVNGDINYVIPDEWGGGAYNDGTLKWHPGVVADANISKVYGEPFARKMWETTLEKATNPVLDDWREHFGVMTARELFEQKDAVAIYQVPFYPDGVEVMTQDMEQAKSNIIPIVKEYSWKMVFAKDEAEFNSLYEEMVTKANGMGYEEIVAWYIQQAEREFEARKNPLT